MRQIIAQKICIVTFKNELYPAYHAGSMNKTHPTTFLITSLNSWVSEQFRQMLRLNKNCIETGIGNSQVKLDFFRIRQIHACPKLGLRL